ncbi:hypothetical protein EJP77_15005 [Paenibacillus zeisoli]|uniref:DUF1232 domain-containing protein n=1 Tax=Paenibacillus zeisoli TaxID=2496267 RepID=A0A433X6M0_9BACL|nr:hypothetical protein [Paenibacillus zeisoli]RUT29671.1 hypothetical protein EJP77_15005 [Paenibacillus zeisoli]
MKLQKLWSLKRWAHIFRRLPRLITSSQIPLSEKLLFLVPAGLYWVLPDVMPFMPLDDIAVSMFLMNWFVTRAEKKYPLL